MEKVYFQVKGRKIKEVLDKEKEILKNVTQEVKVRQRIIDIHFENKEKKLKALKKQSIICFIKGNKRYEEKRAFRESKNNSESFPRV